MRNLESTTLVAEFKDEADLETRRTGRRPQHGESAAVARMSGATCDECGKSGMVSTNALDGYTMEYGGGFDVWCQRCAEQHERRVTFLTASPISSLDEIVGGRQSLGGGYELSAFAARPEWSDERTVNEAVTVWEKRLASSGNAVLELVQRLRNDDGVTIPTVGAGAAPDIEVRLYLTRRGR